MNTTLRPERAAAEDELGRPHVTVVNPGGKARHMASHLPHKGAAVGRVKGVSEVELDKHFPPGVAVAETPLTGRVEAGLCSEGLSDTNLQWPKVLAGLLPEG